MSNEENSAKSISDNSKLVELTVKSNVVDWGGIVIVYWKHSGFPTTNDWIGIYKKGEPTHTQYVDYKYVTVSESERNSILLFFD